MSKAVHPVTSVLLPLAIAFTAYAGWLSQAPLVQAEDRPFKDVVQLTPQSYDRLNTVKVSTIDVATGKPLPEAAKLTDLWLRLSAPEGDINEIIVQKSASKPERKKRLFTVELFAIVNGRIHSDTTGECTPWNEEVSWCALGCDGQGFRLKRISTDPYKMSILLTSEAKHDDRQGFPPAGPLSLTLCGADDKGHELLIVPANGDTGEIALWRE